MVNKKSPNLKKGGKLSTPSSLSVKEKSDKKNLGKSLSHLSSKDVFKDYYKRD
jgi:hypothetical protein